MNDSAHRVFASPPVLPENISPAERLAARGEAEVHARQFSMGMALLSGGLGGAGVGGAWALVKPQASAQKILGSLLVGTVVGGFLANMNWVTQPKIDEYLKDAPIPNPKGVQDPVETGRLANPALAQIR